MGNSIKPMNAQLESKIYRSWLMKFASSKLLPAFDALNRRMLNHNLAHPELIEMSK